MITIFESLFNYKFGANAFRTYFCDEYDFDFVIDISPINDYDKYRCTIEMV